VGGCKIPKGKQRVTRVGETRDLFCFGDEGEEDWEDVIIIPAEEVKYQGAE
jgi:hypothetical protein